MSGIYVNICSHRLDIVEQWEALAARAPANVFMHPAALNAVHATKFAKVHALLAWDASVEPHRLVGLWALQESAVARLWPAYLAAPPYNYAFVSNPVADPARIDEVMRAFFDAIERDPALPNVIRLKYLDGELETSQAIVRALAERGSPSLKLSEGARPFVSSAFGQKHSGSTRKKLRQDWNRLSALGSVEIVNDRERGKVEGAFEVFLDSGGRELEGRTRDRAALSRAGCSVHPAADLKLGRAHKTPRLRCCAWMAGRSPRRCCSTAAVRPIPGRRRLTQSTQNTLQACSWWTS